jgi:division protein CdvB (Snf7/Vps24/ESCRT-III family)
METVDIKQLKEELREVMGEVGIKEYSVSAFYGQRGIKCIMIVPAQSEEKVPGEEVIRHEDIEEL